MLCAITKDQDSHFPSICKIFLWLRSKRLFGPTGRLQELLPYSQCNTLMDITALSEVNDFMCMVIKWEEPSKADPFSDDGDSGILVFAEHKEAMIPLGTHFASTQIGMRAMPTFCGIGAIHWKLRWITNFCSEAFLPILRLHLLFYLLFVFSCSGYCTTYVGGRILGQQKCKSFSETPKFIRSKFSTRKSTEPFINSL